ncbi:UDP-N-acetylglucosamine 1-carboxyvinyltransferase [bacterium]
MESIIIKGGRALKGTVTISGSKNAALPILVASLLTDEKITLGNLPKLRDIETMIQVLTYLGKSIEWQGEKLVINHNGLVRKDAPYELVRQMRASALVIGPLLTRHGEVKASLPGGCAIGARPINLHLENLALLGANIQVKEGYVYLSSNGLQGAHIILGYPSVGATENLLMASVLAHGKTIIENAAIEPEIEDLANFLVKMGGKIDGIGTNILTVNGVKFLKGISHSVIPDRIEAGTFMTASAITRGDIHIKGIVPEHLTVLYSKLEDAGLEISSSAKDEARVRFNGSNIKAVDIETVPYPGFPTDMQAQWIALMCTAKGSSVVSETIFENRFMHVGELERMGAHLKIRGNSVFVQGNDKLSGAQVMATDLRASAALILAGLAAQGKTEISRIYHLDRGYESIEIKLKALGADIHRVKEKRLLI